MKPKYIMVALALGLTTVLAFGVSSLIENRKNDLMHFAELQMNRIEDLERKMATMKLENEIAVVNGHAALGQKIGCQVLVLLREESVGSETSSTIRGELRSVEENAFVVGSSSNWYWIPKDSILTVKYMKNP